MVCVIDGSTPLTPEEKAVVTLDDGKAEITFDESAVSVTQLIETIEDAGFDATE